jgi:hypothetical protein
LPWTYSASTTTTTIKENFRVFFVVSWNLVRGNWF